jgi:hypothetical protein
MGKVVTSRFTRTSTCGPTRSKAAGSAEAYLVGTREHKNMMAAIAGRRLLKDAMKDDKILDPLFCNLIGAI